MDTSFEASRPRQRRSARARREQKARAAARVISRLVHASTVLAGHRGCQPGQHLTDLANLLTKPLVTGDQDIAPEPQVGQSDESLYNLTDSHVDEYVPLFAHLPPALPEVPLEAIIRAFEPPGEVPLSESLPAPFVRDLPRRTVPSLVQFFEHRGFDTPPVLGASPTPPVPAPPGVPLDPPQVLLGATIREIEPPEEERWQAWIRQDAASSISDLRRCSCGGSCTRVLSIVCTPIARTA